MANPFIDLIAGADNNKDQSYFLCQLNQQQLSKALFPIGNLQKPEVREIAKKIGLNTADKKDSQGLCFIGKVKLPVFLQQQLKPKEGNILEVENEYTGFIYPDNELKTRVRPFSLEPQIGKVVGTHQGAHYFTVGQRKGLQVGGTPEALFVIGVDTTKNIVYTGQGTNHKGLYRKGLFVKNEEIHWVRPDLTMAIGDTRTYMGRIRYRQELQELTLYKKEEGLFILFTEMQRGITPGQFVAWYDNNELLGSGVIDA